MAFTCSGCGYKYNRVTTRNFRDPEDNTGKIHSLECTCSADLAREVVLGEHATLKIPALDVEVTNSEGKYTTVEGLILSIANNLSRANIVSDAEPANNNLGASITDQLKRKVNELLSGVSANQPFMVEILDPLSVSFISSVPTKGWGPSDRGIISETCRSQVIGASEDERLKVDVFERTPEQNDELGLSLLDSTETNQLFESSPLATPRHVEVENLDGEDSNVFSRAVEAMAAEFTRAYEYDESTPGGTPEIIGEDKGDLSVEKEDGEDKSLVEVAIFDAMD
jgi:C4-type Zn-finger protein